MANFSLEDVKTLRERLGTGMVDTKNALVEADGDIEKAVEILRLKGAKGNAKRADRSTREGLVAVVDNGDGTATLIELACETDFVAKNDKFVALADTGARGARRRAAPRPSKPLSRPLAERQDRRRRHRRRGRDPRREGRAASHRALVGRAVRRLPAPHEQGPAAAGRRRASPTPATTPRPLAVAQHISFADPQYLTREDVPADDGRERAPHRRADQPRRGQARGRPSEDRRGSPRRVLQAGRPARAGLREDNKLSVGKVLADAGLTVSGFARFKVGA